MYVFVTDLDGTLLDDDYSFEAALPALNLLDRLRIPLVLCTSKTRAEVEACRARLGNDHPFIVENGGALYVPDGCLPQSINAPLRRDGYSIIEFGSPYPELVRCLARASSESGCTVRGFHQMDAAEIGERCGMRPEAALRAKQREYDEPFEILSGDADRLTDSIERQKKRWTRGGSFYHILGANDKAHCVQLLVHFYRRMFDRIVTVGLGDGLNDAGFLNMVDVPVLLESDAISDLRKEVPQGRTFPGGPRGWNSAVLAIIGRHPQPTDIESRMAAAMNGPLPKAVSGAS